MYTYAMASRVSAEAYWLNGKLALSRLLSILLLFNIFAIQLHGVMDLRQGCLLLETGDHNPPK